MERKRFLVIVDVSALENDPSDPPAWVRLRRWLKAMLRQYNCRCESVTIAKPEGAATDEVAS